MKAFVTDGNERSALAITRSLGRRGVSVLVGEQHEVSLASSSRYCARGVRYPPPHRQPEAFQRFLADFVEREAIDVIVPVTDVTTWTVCRHQEGLRRHAAMAVPSFAAFDLVSDKSAALRAAAGCGIPIPRTHFVRDLAGLRQVAQEVEYPAVIKPARSRVLTEHGWVGDGVYYASSDDELWRLYEETGHLASHPSLIQQRIVGPGLGLFALFDRGEPVAFFAHRRLREQPPSGGVSVLCESVAVDPRLREQAVRLLGPLRWHGVAMLEYKQDHRTGECFLIEVNGRFWGSLQLAVAAGVDFPYLAYQLALGQMHDVPRDYHVGLKNRWLLGDLDHLLARLAKTRETLCLSVEAPSRLRVLIDFLKCMRPGVGDQVVSGSDPRPFRYELRRYARASWASVVRRGRARMDGLRRLVRSLWPGRQDGLARTDAR